jgi:hypothetical protein
MILRNLDPYLHENTDVARPRASIPLLDKPAFAHRCRFRQKSKLADSITVRGAPM